MKKGQSLTQLTSRLLLELEKYFEKEKPELVLAHGDTTTCFAAAISSFYHQIPFFHVEAGLRTHHLKSPFPEEFNRQATAPIATHHFAPTETEKNNLLEDGVALSKITITGSTVHEAVQLMQSKLDVSMKTLSFLNAFSARQVVVVTLHRREATHSLQRLLAGLKKVAERKPGVIFVCPVHPNPEVQSTFQAVLANMENVFLIDPLGYPQFISLLTRANFVVTDSGGIQEEATFLGKKVFLARHETERNDGLQSGLVQLIGLNSERLESAILDELANPFVPQGSHSQPMGHSRASEIIADEVQRAVG